MMTPNRPFQERRMSKDRTLPELAPLLAQPLGWLTRRLLRWPRATTLVTCLLALLACFVAARWLGFRTNRLDLLNPTSEFNQRWHRYLDEFGRDDDLLVVLAAEDHERLAAATDKLAAELARHPTQFKGLVFQRNLERLRQKGLHLLSVEQLQRLAWFVEQARPLVAQDWEATSPERFPALIAYQLAQSRQAVENSPVAPASFTSAAVSSVLPQLVERWANEIESAALGQPQAGNAGDEFAELFERFDELRAHHVLLPDGQHALVALRLTEDDPQDPQPRAAAIAKLREIMREVSRSDPRVTLKLTGMPVLEDDEMNTSQRDMTWASALSFLGVIVILRVGFGRWRDTLLAVAILVMGMAWSFGLVAIWPGHLNLLSVSFAAILIGLGIDFGIHYQSRFLELREAGLGPRRALVGTATSIGPGVITGAVTTAVAFFAAGSSEFTGVAELGWIAGAGVLLCLAATLVALPSLAYLAEPRRRSASARESRWLGDLLERCHAHPAIPLAFLAAAGAASFGLNVLRYDHNLLNLQTDGLESVELERMLATGDQRSVWFAVSMANDLDELRERKARFEQLPSVARVEELGSLIVPADPVRERLVASIHHALETLPSAVPLLPAPSGERFRAELAQLTAQLEAFPRRPDELEALVSRLRRLAQTVQRVSADVLSLRLAGWRQKSLDQQLRTLRGLREISTVQPPDWDDIPAELVERFRGRSGQHLLRVYAREDVWELEPLRDFVLDLESVDAGITGHPIQTFYASRQIQQSYVHSGVYALICVLIVVYLDFRHFGHALLALVPLLLGFLLTFGLAGWLRLPLNAANLLVLPLLLGIGIDSGVHVIHDWRSQTSGYRLSRSLALSVILCSTTTIAGFAGLTLASHQGLRSLGVLLCIGMTISLATSLLFLPACLKAFSRPPPKIRP